MHDQASSPGFVGAQCQCFLEIPSGRGVDHLDPAKSRRLKRVEDPALGGKAAVPPGVLPRMVIAGKESDLRYPFMERRNKRRGLEDKLARRHRTDALQSVERVTKMVKQPGAEHDVEGADKLRTQLVGIDAAILDVAVEVFARQQESLQSAFVPYIDRQNALCSASLEFKREVAVPGADIEDGLSCQIGEFQQCEPAFKAAFD